MAKESKQVVVSEPTTPVVSNPQDLMALAIKQGAYDQMEKLMEMQIRWENRESKKAYTRAMAGFHANRPKILKNKRVDYETSKGRTSYNHADLAQAVDLISQELAKHGLSAAWTTNQTDKKISVTCIITHIMGHSENTTLSSFPDESGGKNAIQAIGSTVTYLKRYTLFAATGIEAEGVDDDGRGSEIVELISTDEAIMVGDALRVIYQGDHHYIGQFYRHNGVEGAEDINKGQLPGIVKDLKILAGKAKVNVDL